MSLGNSTLSDVGTPVLPNDAVNRACVARICTRYCIIPFSYMEAALATSTVTSSASNSVWIDLDQSTVKCPTTVFAGKAFLCAVSEIGMARERHK